MSNYTPEELAAFHAYLKEVHDRVQNIHPLNCTCDDCTSDEPYPVEESRNLNPLEGIDGKHNQIGGSSCPACHDQGCMQCTNWRELCM